MKIIIADDHIFSLKGTESFVKEMGYNIVGTCSNGITALNLILSQNPDLAILDINMPGMDGLMVLKKIKESNVRTKVIILSMHNEVVLYELANENGAFGYVLKNQAETELKECIETVLQEKKYVSNSIQQNLDYLTKKDVSNKSPWTEIEEQILTLIADSKTSKQIAENLFVSEKAIEYHRSKIIQKLRLPAEKNSLLKWAILNFTNEKSPE